MGEVGEEEGEERWRGVEWWVDLEGGGGWEEVVGMVVEVKGDKGVKGERGGEWELGEDGGRM